MKKKIVVWGASLLAAVIVFAAVGFLAVPPLLKSQLQKYAHEELQRDLAIGEIKLNPFDLALEIKDLSLKDKDGSLLLGFKRLFVDYEIFPALFKRAFGFREISLTRPEVNLVIDKSGSANLARLAADATRNQPPEEKEHNNELPRLIIGKLAIDDAGMELTDHRRTGPFKTEVDPVDLVLNNFNTLPNQTGKQMIVASTPDGEELRWEGKFSLSPVTSSGDIALTNFSGPKLWRYLQDFVNFEITGGSANFQTTYDFGMEHPNVRLTLNGIKVELKDWQLKSRGSEDRVLALNDIQVGPGEFDLQKHTASIEKVLFQGGQIGIVMGSDNLINWVDLLKLKGVAAAKETAAGAKTAAPGTEGAPWKITFGEFRLSDLAVTFTSLSAQTPFDLNVAKAGLGFGAVIDYASTGSQLKVQNIVVGLADLALKVRSDSAPIATVASVDLASGSFDYKEQSAAFDTLTITRPRVDAWLDKERQVNLLGLVPKGAGNAGAAAADASGVAPIVEAEKSQAGKPRKSASRQAKGKHTAKAPPAPVAPEKAEEPPASATTEAVAGTRGQAWRVGVKTITLADGGVTVSDRGLEPPVTVNLEPIAVRLDGASSDLKQPVGYDAAVGVKQGGQFSSKGSIVPAAPSAEGTLSLKELSLKPTERYINRFALLVLNSGTVSMAGKYAFAMKDKQPSAQFGGGFQVAKLDLVEEDTKERFLGWDMMDVRGIDFKLEPAKLDIVEVRFDKPGGKFIIYEDRTLNVQRILRQKGGVGGEGGPKPAFTTKKEGARGTSTGDSSRQVGLDSATSSMRFGAAPADTTQPPPASPAPKASAPLFPVNIQRVRVNNGEVYFADLSLTPQFGTRIHDLNGTVNSLSTRKGSKAQVKLEGGVDQYGLARFSGDLYPFAPTDYMNVTATFRNVELTSMTPYSAKFAGYRIASGTLDADLEYFIQMRQLKGENKIIIDQLTLGERVESPDAVKLPLELAIALLKDSDGKIDLGLPVSGSLDDPQFSIGALVWKVVVNVLTKIVTAPFRALGALLGIEGDKLESVSFDLGSDQLLPPEKAKLKQVAAAIEKRPQLKVGIRPVYAAEDAGAIKSLRVRRELATRAGFKLQEGEDPGPIDTSDPKNQKVIDALFVERFGKDARNRLTEAVEKGVAGEGKEVTRDVRKEAQAKLPDVMFAQLVEKEQVSDEELQALAQRRAEALRQEFQAQGALPADKVAVQSVEKVEAADKKSVQSKFALTSK